MDTISIHELKLETLVGVYEHELAAPQTIQIDLHFGIPDAKVFSRDNIKDAVDYSAVVTRMREHLGSKHRNLIETVAEEIAQLLLREFKVPMVKVRVAKIGVMKGVKQIAVEIERPSKQ